MYASDQATAACIDLARKFSQDGMENAGSCDGFQAFGMPSHFNNWYYVTLLPQHEAMSKNREMQMVLVIYSCLLYTSRCV